jgi:hypothetical protein
LRASAAGCAEEVIGRVGLADEGGQVKQGRVGGEGAAAGLTGEVLVEAQAHDAHPGQLARDQLQGVRGDARGDVVPVPVGGTAAGQQQRRGEPPPGLVRRDVERPVGSGAADDERDVAADRRDRLGRRTRRGTHGALWSLG